MTKPELDRLERIATAMLGGVMANSNPQVFRMDRAEVVKELLITAQELIKQLDALAEAE